MSPRTGQNSSSGPRLVDREGLVTALERAANGQVTIVTAPAGSGKTTLLQAWADRRDPEHRLAIVHVQHDKQDSQIFWLAMLGAARSLSGDPVSAEPPTPSPDFSGPMMVDRILSELTGRGGRVTLVIDDVHELTSPDTFFHLTRLLTSLPEGVHAILATRRDLPLRLHRLRLDGRLAELRAVDLQFSEEETRALLTAEGITLSDAAVARLHERTEGWAAGLRLAVISLKGHPDAERFVSEFTGSSRTVSEYLVAEMLEHQPEEVQNMLLRTSILQRVNGELADLLTGRPGSERILLDLEEANAFVVSLDRDRTWFRYHHLFGDLLRLELRRLLPDEVRALHRRAAGWLTGRGLTVEAVRQLQAAGDWPEAAALLADHSFGMMLDGLEESMQTLLEAFPHNSGTDFPELSVVRTMVSLSHGRLDEAAAHLAVAESAGEGTRLRSAIVSLNLSLARRRGDLEAVMRHATFLDGGETWSGDLRVMALMNLGTVEAWTLGRSEAERHLQEGADLARRIGRPYLEVACLAQLGFATKLPDFTYSRKRCEEAIALAEEHGWGTAFILAPALVTLACAMVWMGEFDSAERILHRADQALHSDSGPGIGTLLHLAKGMLHAGRGRKRDAAAEFATAGDLQSRLPQRHALTGFVTGWLLATQARLGYYADARATLEALDSPLIDSGEIRNAGAAICLAEGDPPGALAAIKAVIDGTAPAVHVATLVEAGLLAALAHRSLGADDQAHRSVEQALALAEPERLVLPFAMTGAADLLHEMPRRRSAHAALLTDILDILEGSPPPSEASGKLSPTELRILQYLPTNLSRPEIADELFVSLNTVNTHIRNIYTKLQATDRSAAVQRARELRLLASRSPR